MANTAWRVNGEYFEACSCESVCPCPTSGLAARPLESHFGAWIVCTEEPGPFDVVGIDEGAVLARLPQSFRAPKRRQPGVGSPT